MKTVNFIEAVNSGKRFKSEFSSENNWLCVENGHVKANGDCISISTTRFFTSNFTLEEKEITITESKIESLIYNAPMRLSMVDRQGAVDYIKKELGF